MEGSVICTKLFLAGKKLEKCRFLLNCYLLTLQFMCYADIQMHLFYFHTFCQIWMWRFKELDLPSLLLDASFYRNSLQGTQLKSELF